jgi:hypothetical protein
MSKETETILNAEYAKYQIQHMRNLIDLLEFGINNTRESPSEEFIKINFALVEDNISILREEVTNFKYNVFCEVEIDNDETNQ